MSEYRYGFAFKLKGEECITLYSPENSAEIEDAIDAMHHHDGDWSLRVKHVVRRGPRAGTADTHLIDLVAKDIENLQNGVLHRLVKVTIDAEDTTSMDVVVASIKAEREKAKAEYDAIVRKGDERLSALLAQMMGSGKN